MILDSLINNLKTQLDRRRHRPFLRATMAACALVAAADGAVSLRERVRVDQVLDYLETLRIFDPHEGVELFNEFADAILATPREGHEHALAAIREEVDQHPESAELLIRVCIGVSKVDDHLPMVEQIEIVSLMQTLGVEVNDPLLYATPGGPDITSPGA
ncbi:MAG: TerB family tellurite resistance protein [Gammaproteobacteria bacterium]